MILTPIPREELAGVLDHFRAGLSDRLSREAFAQIRATSPDRAAGAEAERQRLAALSFTRGLGMAIHPEGTSCRFNWDGAALNGATEAYVILHEVAHFALAPLERRGLVEFGLGPGPDTLDHEAAERAAVVSPLAREEDESLASPERRGLVEFGLGPGPDTLDRDTAERAAVLPLLARETDEAAASLLGILWEAALGQPALASFLDQNWLEGLDRSAAGHFTAVVETLQHRGLLSLERAPAVSTAPTDG